jgi:hypothetical protein
VISATLPSLITSYIASNFPSISRPYEVTAATDVFIIVRNVPVLFDERYGAVGMIPSGVMTGFALKGGFLYTIENDLYLLKLSPTTGSLYESVPINGIHSIAHSAEDDLVYTNSLTSLNVDTGATTATACTMHTYSSIAFDVDNHLWVY